MMKKLLAIAMISGTLAFTVPAAEAKTSASPAVTDPQIRVQIGRNRNRRWNRNWNRRVRTVVTTRIVHIGRYRYRETIRTTYMRNGRTRTQVISRTRLGRW